MSSSSGGFRLDRPVDVGYDHILGPGSAQITLVEYGSYDCPYCRAANAQIARTRDELGDRVRYVFRHRPITGSDIAVRAAELAESAPDEETFWSAHIKLMTRSQTLTDDDLAAVAADLKIASLEEDDASQIAQRARDRVEADRRSAKASGVMFTPTFFINGRRYDGAWDEASLSDAMLGRLGHRVGAAALDFVSWGPSAGVLLLVATVLAVALMNSPLGPGFEHFWEQDFGISLGAAEFKTSVRHWVNDGLLTVFFLVVGLEIKREFTVGRLANPRAAALPIAAALGGMLVPALIYLAVIRSGPLINGWGVPMATDTAFAVALIFMMGQRVPIALRVFLTAAAIVDDIGAIVVVALFYTSSIDVIFLLASAGAALALAFLNRARVFQVAPYAVLGVILWACIYASGLHATLAGVVLAFFIPTRPPPDLEALAAQANTIISAEARRGSEVLRHGPSLPSLKSLEAIKDRLESPADRLLRKAGARSSYLVLPIFALANAGVEFPADVTTALDPLMLAIVLGLAVRKPLGIVGASALAVRLGIANKPDEYSWRHLAGAGALAGIGFTMSLFIAGEAFTDPMDFTVAKIAVFLASVLAAGAGVAILWNAPTASAPEGRSSVEGTAVGTA
ncbi:Na+/H+ antiporter NhaA [Microbaculum marinum]|uniref:Na(+)/H(+) antiporter NhaA n=1 Tax=Microbaculum marinum TaxID=1764581 RepID=A0AAW9S121_9HYPH